MDLLGGAGPAQLVPYHVLTVLLLLVVWGGRLRERRWPPLPTEVRQFAALVLGLATLVTLSLLRSVDFSVSAGRAVLLLSTVLSVPAIIWGVSEREDLLSLLGRGARLGLIAALVLNATQALHYLTLIPDSLFLGPIEVKFTAMRYGILPRFAGTAWDQNRGAMLCVIFGVLVSLPRPAIKGRRAWIALAAAMALLSLSRSAALAAVPALLLTPRLRAGGRGLRWAVAASLIVVSVITALQLNPQRRERSAEALAPLAERVKPGEGSASVHAALYLRAADVSTRDIPTLLGGIGYGASFRVVADVFSGDRYGNFHSTYLAWLVEVGVFALLIGLCLLLAPLRHGGALAGLLLAMLVFNVFYNFDADPSQWLIISIAWLAPRLRQRRLA